MPIQDEISPKDAYLKAREFAKTEINRLKSKGANFQ